MSIKLVQEFIFETDDDKFLKIMLSSIVESIRINFQKAKVLLKEPSDWNDGKYEHLREEVDPHVVPHGSEWGVLDGRYMYHGAVFYKPPDKVFPTKEEAAKYVCSLKVKPRPTRSWLATIYNSDYCYTSYKRGEFYSPKSKDDLVDKVIDIAVKADKNKFLQDFSYAEDRWFDGSVAAGYRLEHRPNGVVDVSMVHILYGK